MALNLNTLTGSTSSTVLAEALTTADFLDSVPILTNLANRGNKGGDAKQTTGLNQPRALPLIKNPQGKLGGYLYIPDVSGNYATGPSVTIGANQTWQAEVDMVITQYGNYIKPLGGGAWTSGFSLLIYSDGRARVFSKSDVSNFPAVGSIPLNTPFNVKYGFNGSAIYIELNGQSLITTSTGSNQAASITHPLHLAHQNNLGHTGNYAIQKAKLTVNNAVVFDCDFNGSTSIRHGDTKFNCVGGPVVLTKAGNDPATVIKKPVLRFANKSDNTTNICLEGLFNETINGGYMFAVFSVLGDGGEGNGRVFSVDNGNDNSITAAIFSLGITNNLRSYYRGGLELDHVGLYDDALGNVLQDVKLTAGSQVSKVNNADQKTATSSGTLSSINFNISSRHDDDKNASLDLEYLALFPATITDAQADSVRNYINNRNNVFSLIDSQGYYFFDPHIFPIVDPADFVSYWNGNIVGSDNTLNASVSQSVVNHRPTRDGYKITFNDNADHLVVASPLSGGQAGWQVVGTSLGTFAYRVDNDAVTELNLLGNLGNASYRKAGQSYGMILLPDSATGADIEAARKLLIDRGAEDGVAPSDCSNFWRGRADIINFKNISFNSVTDITSAWRGNSAMTTFSVSFPSVTQASNAFFNCSSLSDFGTTDLKNCVNFASTWKSCSALTSFPAGAKLGTSASNVNFTSAFQSSGLTSFPALDLSKGTNFASAFQSSDLASFPSGINMSNGTNFANTWRDTDIVEFPLLNLDKSSVFLGSWRFNNLMTTFPAGFFDTWNPGSMNNFVFNDTWDGCTALTAQSVENILVSIDASGQYATSNGASGSSAITDTGIDIDYDGTTLSAATNSAIDSLSGKGWQVIINNVNLSMDNTYSVAFDGTDDYMSMTLPVLGNTHTLSAWFKTTASYGGAGSEGTLISYISSGGGGDDSVLSVITDKVGWSDFVDDDQIGTSTVNDGNWHQAVVVVTASTQKIYVDGVLETTTSNAYSAGTSFSSATIGRRANAAQRFFNGNIDEVAIWNSELSATDVTAIYNGGRPVNLNVNTNGYDNSSTLVAWWRMGDNDSGTGSTVTDNSANSYNGTLINGPTFQTNTP